MDSVLFGCVVIKLFKRENPFKRKRLIPPPGLVFSKDTIFRLAHLGNNGFGAKNQG